MLNSRSEGRTEKFVIVGITTNRARENDRRNDFRMQLYKL
jgi:hypothetical protein